MSTNNSVIWRSFHACLNLKPVFRQTRPLRLPQTYGEPPEATQGFDHNIPLNNKLA